MNPSSKSRSLDYVWLLNPDAELELAHAARSGACSYSPKGTFLRTMESKRELFRELTQEDPWRLLSSLDRSPPRGLGLLWCPTPSAVERAARAGFDVAPAPAWQCLLRIHDKTRLGEFSEPCLPGRAVIENQIEWQTTVSRLLGSTHPTFGAFSRVRAKRPYGFAGRGQRTFSMHLSKHDERWVADSLRQGALAIEPDIEHAHIGSIHGLVEEHDTLVGDVVPFDNQPPIQFTETSKADAKRMAVEVAAALRASSYAGPFGLDLIFDREGAPFALDLNPRFTLRWSTGLGNKRDCAVQRLLSRIPQPS